MKIYDIYKKCGINLDIDINEWVEKYFYFLSRLPTEYIAKIDPEKLYSSDEFWNNDAVSPIITLLENDKINRDAFRHIISTEYWGDEADKTKFYDLVVEYIVKNKIDIGEYFTESYIVDTLAEILSKHNFDIDDLLKNIDLEKHIEKESIGALLFNYRKNEDSNNQKLINFTLENFELISSKFFKYSRQNNFWIYNFIANDYVESNGMLRLAGYIIKLNDPKYFNKYLMDKFIEEKINRKLYDEAYTVIKLIEYVFPDMYKNKMNDSNMIKHMKPKSEIELDNLTVESFHEYLDTLDDYYVNIVARDMKYHRMINTENEVNFKYREHMFYTDFTEEFFNFYVDIAIKNYENKNTIVTDNWRWSGFYQDLVYDVMYWMDAKDIKEWMPKVLTKMIDCDLFKNTIVSYLENNGNISALEVIADHNPDFIKENIDHDKLFKSVVFKNNSSW